MAPHRLFRGRLPATIQKGVKPGHVPQHVLARCLVAYGLLLEGAHGRLAVAADWFPYNISATTDDTRIAALLNESEVVSIGRYIEHYRSS